jgi:hypothetical protein
MLEIGKSSEGSLMRVLWGGCGAHSLSACREHPDITIRQRRGERAKDKINVANRGAPLPMATDRTLATLSARLGDAGLREIGSSR